jgi:hypothetical protein
MQENSENHMRSLSLRMWNMGQLKNTYNILKTEP